MTGPVDEVYWTIRDGMWRDGPPVFSASELGDIHDVSRPTIHKYLDKVSDLPGIKSAKIDRADVYWYDMVESTEDQKLDLEEAIEDYQSSVSDEFILNRAKSLSHRETLLEKEVAGEVSWEDKVYYIFRLVEYLHSHPQYFSHLTSCFDKVARDTEWLGEMEGIDEEPGEFEIPEGSSLTKDEFEYYNWNAHMFTVNDGREVTGLAEFATFYHSSIRSPLKDEYGNIALENANPGDLKPLLPKTRDLISGGDVVEEFMSKLMDVRW